MVDTFEAGQMLGTTAYWTAAVRAQESQRPDPLFNDPWAALLAGETGRTWLDERTADAVLPMVLRTRYFDDFLRRVVHENGVRQVVLMAAGLDTRAYRLDWPAATCCFELDQPAILAYKERTLQAAGAAPTCVRRAIGEDLTTGWETALAAAGFDPRQPSGWLLEGFLFYLASDFLVDILARVSKLAAPGSLIGFDIINSATLTSPLTQKWVQMQAEAGAPWLGALDDPRAFLEPRGWQVTLTSPGAPDANYGRWSYPTPPVEMPGMPHLWYVTGHKA